ncbi:MAG: GatB/YqeY domain-containing protein [Ignavibacteria bacterium]
MSLKTRINDDMKTAMKAREAARLAAIRLLMAAMKQKEVDERIELDDAGVIAVIEKMIKQRKDSIAQYEAAKRQDLADAEKFEVEVLSAYMPQALSHDEIALIVGTAIAESGAKSPAEMGKVVALVKPRVAGRADMGEVSKLIRARLAGA